MHGDLVISAQGLTRYFGHRPVVHTLDLAVPRGSVTGLLGLNGAGKTTTLRMLLGFLEPTRGTSQILGKDSQSLTAEDRARIGYTVEGHFLYGWMTVPHRARIFRSKRFRIGTVHYLVARYDASGSTRLKKFAHSVVASGRVFHWR